MYQSKMLVQIGLSRIHLHRRRKSPSNARKRPLALRHGHARDIQQLIPYIYGMLNNKLQHVVGKSFLKEFHLGKVPENQALAKKATGHDKMVISNWHEILFHSIRIT